MLRSPLTTSVFILCAGVAHAHLSGRARVCVTHTTLCLPLRAPPPLACASTSPSPPPSASERIAAVASLCAHVESSGGTIGGVAAEKVDGEGIGLKATRDMRRGDALATVPTTMVVTAERALRSDLGPFLVDFEPELADYAFIAVCLLHEERLGEQVSKPP